MTIEQLPPVMAIADPPHFGADSPIRKVTRQVAFENRWDATRARKVADLFDGMADTWTADHDVEGRYRALDDALHRGVGLAPGDFSRAHTVIELGSGTGLGTRTLHQRFERVFAFDLALAMLQNADPTWAPLVQADASALPLPDGVADVVVLVNMLLFPSELDRVLAPGGRLVWINTVGAQTPIHLSAADVVAALPGTWQGTASRAGIGTWAVVQRQ